MDVKEANDFKDPTGNFIKDSFAFALCGDDLYWGYINALDEPESIKEVKARVRKFSF